MTKEKIVEKALELFNDKGIEYVGMRELAADLNMRVGNITYYFPTKDNLVWEVSRNLGHLNTQTIDTNCPNLTDFFSMYKQLFYNQYQYRCLLLSFVHLVTQNPLLAQNYKETERKRREGLKEHISILVKNGSLLDTLDGATMELIISHFSLISRFWLSESRISYADMKIENIIEHYQGLMYGVLLPYSTVKGKREIAALINEKQ